MVLKENKLSIQSLEAYSMHLNFCFSHIQLPMSSQFIIFSLRVNLLVYFSMYLSQYQNKGLVLDNNSGSTQYLSNCNTWSKLGGHHATSVVLILTCWEGS